jgi:prevent-host-death family protein
MERIGVRELRQHASKYLARVAHGETIEFTDRGRPIARLVPTPRDTWQELVDRGWVIEASAGGGVLDDEPIDAGIDASARLEGLRADER